MKLEGTQSLITGASSGIGLVVAQRLIQKGNNVHSFDVQPPLKQIDGLASHSVDIRDPQQVSRGMTEIGGKLHILFNNAGVLVRGGLFDISHEQFRKMLDVNALGSWLTVKTTLDQDKLVDGGRDNRSDVLNGGRSPRPPYVGIDGPPVQSEQATRP